MRVQFKHWSRTALWRRISYTSVFHRQPSRTSPCKFVRGGSPMPILSWMARCRWIREKLCLSVAFRVLWKHVSVESWNEGKLCIFDMFFCFTVELAMIMDRLYGGVCYAGIDTDPELKYPKVKKRSNLWHREVEMSLNDAKILLFMCELCLLISLFLFTTQKKLFRALVVWHFRVSRATSLPFPLASFNCNTMTLTNASRWSRTFSTIKCVTNVKDNDAVANSLRSSVLMSHACRYVLT